MQSLVTRLTVQPSGLRRSRELRGFHVRTDGFIPRPNPDEEMRRHVIRMSRSRRNTCVHACGRKASLCQHRVVVAMDDVMYHSGMVRQFLEDGFEDLTAAVLIGKGLIGFGRGDGER